MKRPKKRQRPQANPSSGSRTVRMPAYLRRFTCIGSRCEDVCCVGDWYIAVDAPSYERTKRITNPQVLPLIQQFVIANPPETASPDDTARILPGANGRCAFLNEEQLCALQLAEGEAALCDTCYAYPRATFVTDGAVERSGLMSCPEVARLALLEPGPIEMLDVAEPRSTRMAVQRRASTEGLPSGHPRRYWRRTRELCVQLLQRREASIEARLLALGLALQRLSERKSLTQQELVEVFGSYEQSLGMFEQQIGAITPRYDILLELLRELTVERVVTAYALSPRYRSVADRMAQGLGISPIHVVGPETLQAYAAALESAYRPYTQAHPYVIENLLVNQVLNSPFPFHQESMYDDFVLLVARYALIKMHLVGIAAYEQRVDDELLVEVVQSFQKNVDHDPKFLAHALELLRKSDFGGMALMAMLIVS